MANVNGGLMNRENNQIQQQQQQTVKGLLANVNYKKRFEEILGKKAAGFMSSIINISNNANLKECEPGTVISAAVVAATLDLPIDPNLGFAYIVPYNDKKKGKIAQFQMGYRGFIQLAMRSSQYKTISSSEVYEGEIKRFNRITGDMEFNEDFEVKEDSKIIGYIAYFRLINGFEKYKYMTVEELEKHASKYSQSYKSTKQWVKDSSLWTTDFQSMATKTVLKLLLSKYGILSIDMQKALETDQAVITDNGDSQEVEYVDNEKSEAVETDFEVVEDSILNEETPFD